MSLAAIRTRFKDFSRIELAALAFFFIAGIILLVSLPMTDFPPQSALLGILSIITAYGMFTKRGWAPWLIFILFLGALTFSIYTLIFTGFGNILMGTGLTVYAALTVIFTLYILVLRRRPL